jgi:hypothetical protein
MWTTTRVRRERRGGLLMLRRGVSGLVVWHEMVFDGVIFGGLVKSSYV